MVINMSIEYNTLDNAALLNTADIMSKREAIEGELEIIQNERATAQITWTEREQSLKAERNRLIAEMRTARKATVTKSVPAA